MNKYEIQSIENVIPNFSEIAGLNAPKINAATSVYGIKGISTQNSKMYASSQKLFQAGLVTVPLDTEVFANGVVNNITTNRMTIKEAGYYMIVGKISWDTPVAGASHWTYIYRNGAVLGSTITQAAAANAFSAVCVEFKRLEVDDYIQLKGYQNSGQNVYSRAGEDNTNLFLCKIS